MLATSCDALLSAVVILPDFDFTSHARFAELTDDSVSLDLVSDVTDEPKLLATCTVSFYREGRAHIFISSVREFGRPNAGGFPRLVLRLPKQIVGTDVRETFRVPVVESAPLEVALTAGGGGPYQPRALDVSLGGMQLEFSADADPDLAVGTPCSVSLTLAKAVVELDGEIRRRSKHQYGVFFSGILKAGELRPPDTYRAIIIALERLWLNWKKR